MTPKTQNKRWLRIVALVLACGLLLWLPIEETSPRYTILFAFGIYIWWSIRKLVFYPPHTDRFIIHHLFIGILAGPGVTLIASLLMVFKIGLHLHIAPDFTITQFYNVLLLTPVWSVIGIILGLGFGLLRLSRVNSNKLPSD